MTCRHVLVTCRWGSSFFPLAEYCCCRQKNRGTDRLRQRSANLKPMRKKVISVKHVNYLSTRKQQNILQLATIKKIAVPTMSALCCKKFRSVNYLQHCLSDFVLEPAPGRDILVSQLLQHGKKSCVACASKMSSM